MPDENDFGDLHRLNVRDFFANEAQDFTPWLSRTENLKILSDTLGLELELEGAEENVGPYRADILCSDLGDTSKVLIENQLEKSDHLHLGQLLTYASGLETVTIIWIAVRITDEHRAALEWLNEITDLEFSFFGLEFELWCIGDSKPAPKFNIVCKPNNWKRDISRTSVGPTGLSELNKRQLSFWQKLREVFDDINSPLRRQQARPQHWMDFSIGVGGFKLVAFVNSQRDTVGVGFETHASNKDGKAYFDLLHEEKDEIERELGFKADWNRRDGKKSTRIWYERSNSLLVEVTSWEEYANWMHDNLLRFRDVFIKRLETIDVSDWVDPDHDEDAE